MNKFRKEKYILQIQSERTKKWTFRVRYGCYDERFNEDDYLSASQAFKAAVEYRNNLLIEPKLENITKSNTTINNIWNDVKVLYPRSDETYRKLDCSYELYVSHKDTPISKVKTEDIQTDLNNLIYKCSDDTISRVRSIWIKIYDAAIIKKYVNNNLAKLIDPPKSKKLMPNKRNELITLDDLDRLIAYLQEHLTSKHEKKYCEPILKVLYYTGMRPSEMFALEKKDIDIINCTISINKKINSSRETLRLDTTKTDESNRIIPFSSKIKPYFEELLRGEYNLLFPDEKGKYYLPSALSNRYHQMAQKIGIDFHMYQCRHTYITMLYQKGVDIKTIQDLVGQKIDATTLGYVISSKDRMKNAIDLI